MNKLFFILFITFFQSAFAQSTEKKAVPPTDSSRQHIQQLAASITNGTTGNLNKAKILLQWVSDSLQWLPTDYQLRSVPQILARGGGNCFELARVYINLIQAADIQYRPVAEINLHTSSETRQASAEKKVVEQGNRLSVFGKQHNDHRWLEIYDSASSTWIPADPSMNVLGTEQWLKARAWFGERVTTDTSVTRNMIVPFAIFVTGQGKQPLKESRTLHYLTHELDRLYGHRLSNLFAWNKWLRQLTLLDEKSRQAFEGILNLHDYSAEISELAQIYTELGREYLALEKEKN